MQPACTDRGLRLLEPLGSLKKVFDRGFETLLNRLYGSWGSGEAAWGHRVGS